MSQKPKRKEPIKYVSPNDVTTGSSLAVEGVSIDFKEIQVTKHPWGSDTYLLAYTVSDVRVTPPFISPLAHLFMTKGFCEEHKSNACIHNNVVAACEEVIGHYEQVRENVFKIKLPEIKLEKE